jgi:hypothetical protein
MTMVLPLHVTTSNVRRVVTIFGAVLALPVSALAAAPSPNAQIWSEADFIGSLGKSTTLTGITIGRFGESVPNPTLTAAGLQLDHKIGHWTLGASYRHQVVRHSTGGPSISQLAIAMATYADTFGRSTIAIRARVDNTLHSSGNPWRFRIRGEYRWATPKAGQVSYLFINDEFFYQGSASEWSRTRTQAGMNLKFGRRTDLLLYYQYQYDKLSSPAAINALGLTLKVNLE